MVLVQTGNLYLWEFLQDPFQDLFSDTYINDLPDGLKSNVKVFADNTSDLKNDLDMISKWAYNWKMSFNPDPNKSTQEVLFSRKNSNITHPIIHFNNVQVERANHQRHLGISFLMKI